MGVINHNAVIATTMIDDHASEIEDWIDDLPEEHRDSFAIVPSPTNGYVTVFLAPDGSKEGWGASDSGDKLRAAFIAQLEKYAYEDGSSSWAWVEIGYGEFGQVILRGNNESCYNDLPYAEPLAGDGVE